MVKAFELKEELVNKYGYGDDVAESIADAYKEVCDYYKDELRKYGKSDEDIERYMNAILNEVRTCKFVVSDLKKNDVRSIKLRDGIYESEPIIDDGQFIGVEKTITLPNSFSSPYDRGQVYFRSVMNLSRGALNPYTAYESNIDVRDGFKITSYSKTGKKLFSKGEGLEVGTKDYIMYKFTDRNYPEGYEPSKTSHSERIIAGALMDPLHLGGDMIESGITGDTTILDGKLREYGNTSYTELRDKVDYIHDLESQKRAAVAEDAKYREIEDRINKYISLEIAPITKRLSETLSMDMEDTNEKTI